MSACSSHSENRVHSDLVLDDPSGLRCFLPADLFIPFPLFCVLCFFVFFSFCMLSFLVSFSMFLLLLRCNVSSTDPALRRRLSPRVSCHVMSSIVIDTVISSGVGDLVMSRPRASA